MKIVFSPTVKSTLLAPFAIATMASAISLNSHAQLMLEEVVVTAQKREQTLQDVPLSVSAVSGDKMMEAGITNLDDISAYVPNFNKADTPIGTLISIRGISSGVNQGFEQSVVQYVDDIALGRAPLARAPLMDLARVEVLRGPQNVLFGKNSIAGALSMTTNKPSDMFEGMVQAEYEPEYNGRQSQLMLTGPLSTNLRGRLAMRYYADDGFMENNLNGADEPGREEFTWRGTLAWDISDTAEAILKVEQNEFELEGRQNELGFAYANPFEDDAFYGLTYPEAAAVVSSLTGQDIGSDDGVQDFKRNTNIDETTDIDTDNVTLTVNWDADYFTVTSVTGYLAYDREEFLDTDGSGIDAFTSHIVEDYEQISQEIRFTSPGGETIDWIAGAYYQDWELNVINKFGVDDENLWSALGAIGPAIGNPNLAALAALPNLLNQRDYSGDSETWAAFAQATWNVTDTVRITAGGRYTDEKKTAHREMNVYNTNTGDLDLVQAITASVVFGVDFANLGEATGGAYPIHRLDGKRDEDSFTPTLIAEWDVSDDTMLYASYSKGFKAGGFDSAGNQAGNFEYDDETVEAYEVGSKSRMLDNRLEVNAALYYSEYEDQQVSQFDGTLGFVVGNAAKSTSQGVELDGRFLITEGLTWSLSAAYLDFEYGDYQDASCDAYTTLTTGATLCDLTGSRSIYSPEWSASTTLDYITGLTNNIDVRATVDVNYQDEQSVEPTQNRDLIQDAYTLVNARLALESDNWTVALVGRNLTDEDYMTYATDVPLSATLNTPAYSTNMGRPRTVAIQANYRF